MYQVWCPRQQIWDELIVAMEIVLAGTMWIGE